MLLEHWLAFSFKKKILTLIDFLKFFVKLPTSKSIRTRTFGSFVSIWYVQVSLSVFAHIWPIRADQIINYAKLLLYPPCFPYIVCTPLCVASLATRSYPISMYKLINGRRKFIEREKTNIYIYTHFSIWKFIFKPKFLKLNY